MLCVPVAVSVSVSATEMSTVRHYLFGLHVCLSSNFPLLTQVASIRFFCLVLWTSQGTNAFRVFLCVICACVCFHYLFVGCVYVDSRILRCSTGTHVPTNTHTHTQFRPPAQVQTHARTNNANTSTADHADNMSGCDGVSVIISCGLARIPVAMWLPGKLNTNKQLNEQPTVGTNRGTVQAGRM
jgi:hypothetical protein